MPNGRYFKQRVISSFVINQQGNFKLIITVNGKEFDFNVDVTYNLVRLL